MLAHTISSRKATAPISTSSAGREALTSCSCAATTRTPQPALLRSNSSAIRAASTAISCCVWPTVAAGANRPTTRSERARRDWPCMSFGLNASGVQSSTSVLVGNSNRGGMIPMMV